MMNIYDKLALIKSSKNKIKDWLISCDIANGSEDFE